MSAISNVHRLAEEKRVKAMLSRIFEDTHTCDTESYLGSKQLDEFESRYMNKEYHGRSDDHPTHVWIQGEIDVHFDDTRLIINDVVPKELVEWMDAKGPSTDIEIHGDHDPTPATWSDFSCFRRRHEVDLMFEMNLVNDSNPKKSRNLRDAAIPMYLYKEYKEMMRAKRAKKETESK